MCNIWCCYHLLRRLGFKLTSVELHQDPGPFEGRSTNWATVTRRLISTLIQWRILPPTAGLKPMTAKTVLRNSLPLYVVTPSNLKHVISLGLTPIDNKREIRHHKMYWTQCWWQHPSQMKVKLLFAKVMFPFQWKHNVLYLGPVLSLISCWIPIECGGYWSQGEPAIERHYWVLTVFQSRWC